MIKTLTPRPVRRASREHIQRVGCRQTTAWWWIVETDQNKRTVTIEKIVPKVTVTPQHTRKVDLARAVILQSPPGARFLSFEDVGFGYPRIAEQSE